MQQKKRFILTELGKDEKERIMFELLVNQRKGFMAIMCDTLITRLGRVSLLCKEYNQVWGDFCKLDKGSRIEASLVKDDFVRQEEIIYHIRKCIDEMIYAVWINEVGVNNTDNYGENEIDSIGRYLNRKNNLLICFDEFKVFFNKLNILSNSFKHSVLDYCVFGTGEGMWEDEAGFISYKFKERDKDIRFDQKEVLSNLEEVFNKFLEAIGYYNESDYIYNYPY